MSDDYTVHITIPGSLSNVDIAISNDALGAARLLRISGNVHEVRLLLDYLERHAARTAEKIQADLDKREA